MEEINLDNLRRERNIFIAAFLVLFIINFLANSYATFLLIMDLAEGQEVIDPQYTISRIGHLLVTVGTAIFVFRLSRFLKQKFWLTAIYCIVALVPPFVYWQMSLLPLFQIAAFLGMLYSVKKKTEQLKRSVLAEREEG